MFLFFTEHIALPDSGFGKPLTAVFTQFQPS
jgi:hypothetical protein